MAPTALEELDEKASRGEWVMPNVSYVEPLRNSCALCGQPIPRRYWRETIDDETGIFCGPAHARLYVTYWLPTWGKADAN